MDGFYQNSLLPKTFFPDGTTFTAIKIILTRVHLNRKENTTKKKGVPPLKYLVIIYLPWLHCFYKEEHD